MKHLFLVMTAIFVFVGYATAPAQTVPIPSQKEQSVTSYFFPAEDQPHEGTWLIWPHQYTYGIAYRDEIEDIWVQIVQALHTGERVHIIAYNEAEQRRITALLVAAHVDMARVDFVIAKPASWLSSRH